MSRTFRAQFGSYWINLPMGSVIEAEMQVPEPRPEELCVEHCADGTGHSTEVAQKLLMTDDPRDYSRLMVDLAKQWLEEKPAY